MAKYQIAADVRRRRSRILLGFLLGGMLIATLVAFVSGNNERVRQMWATASVQGDRSAEIHESIDYHFSSKRHGIYRDIPGLALDAPVTVSSDAPSDVLHQMISVNSTRLRIGDPTKKVSGNHRYDIGYRLPLVMSGDELLWNGVGPGWEVPIEHAHIEVVAPWEWSGAECQRGVAPPNDGCTVTQPEPGHLVVTANGLDKHEGILVSAHRGNALASAPSLPEVAPPPPPDDRLDSPFALLGAVLVAALLGMAVTSRVARRAGRDMVGGDLTPTNTAFSSLPAGSPGVTELDDDQLAAMTTTEFAPPPGLLPWQGGLILDEHVAPDHKTAWLLGAAIDGEVIIEQRDDVITIRVGEAHASPAGTLLAQGFDNRQELTLDKYDKAFATMWHMLDGTFNAWGKASNLWDPASDRRRSIFQALGFVAFLLGGALLIGGSRMAARQSPSWIALAAIGALAAGAGLAALARGWELRRRTPVGTGLRLRVESFRRFVAESEASHVEEAARRGVLRQYTAWAVAVGEAKHWAEACASATNVPDMDGLHFASLGPVLSSSTARTSTAPSSSSGGGGGGGFGGGGGGSW